MQHALTAPCPLLICMSSSWPDTGPGQEPPAGRQCRAAAALFADTLGPL